MKTYITFALFFIGIISSNAQTTAIPDPDFEYALIDLGIDSDGIINGHVLTADIAGITSLNLSWYSLNDISGIEDFSALKVLDVSDTGLYGNDLPNNTLDLTALSNLEELYMNSGGDAISIHVQYLDLSNNPNLKIIDAGDVWPLLSINLEGSDLQLYNLDLYAPKYFDENPGSVCITVTNPVQAQNGQGVYASWITCCNLTYSSDCNLGATSFTKNNVQLYPNPVTETFAITSQQNIKSVSIYDLQGKLVKHYFQAQENYSVTPLAKGMYLVEIKTFANQRHLMKFVKN